MKLFADNLRLADAGELVYSIIGRSKLSKFDLVSYFTKAGDIVLIDGVGSLAETFIFLVLS